MEAGIEISEIRYLMLTHHHDAHAGCVNELVKDAQARVIGHERAVAHLASGGSDPDGRPINRCTGILVGVEGKIIHTPGHTHDSISVILSDGSAIVGDAAMNFMEFCETRHRSIYIQDLEQTFQSWEKLREHGAQAIHPSHGDPFAAEELVAAG